jgi:hypothetical protein
MLRTTFLFAFLASLSAGCGGGSSPPPDAPAGDDAPGTPTDAPTADDAPAPSEDAPVPADATSTDAPSPTDAPLADGASPCGYVDVIDRSCETDTDCSVGLHQTDCCGNAVMLVYLTTDYPVYANGESACQASYPACGCPALPPMTDSGEIVTDTSAVLAACVSRGPRNVCVTYVTMRPADGR